MPVVSEWRFFETEIHFLSNTRLLKDLRLVLRGQASRIIFLMQDSLMNQSFGFF